MNPVDTKRIADNVAGVRQRIAEAAARSGRPAEAVRLVAVTKYVELPAVEALLEAGCRDLGESRPQDLWARSTAIESSHDVRWHLVGHLQRNKIRRTLPIAEWIHSVDSERLLRDLESEAKALSRSCKLLIEVNVSRDAAKHGFAPEALEALLPQFAALKHARVCGLMTMAALEGGPDVARRNFAELRELRDRLQRAAPPFLRLDELSMGMSGDFEVAIEEGATQVRVGSALFESP